MSAYPLLSSACSKIYQFYLICFKASDNREFSTPSRLFIYNDVTYSSRNIATLWSYSYSLNPGPKSSNPSPKSLDLGPNLGSLRQSVDWGSNPGPKSSKPSPNSSSPGYTKSQFSTWFVWSSDHLEPCQLFGSWMSAVWILESASITVSGILASSPVPAQTAVVQGMRPELYQMFRSWTWGPY